LSITHIAAPENTGEEATLNVFAVIAIHVPFTPRAGKSAHVVPDTSAGNP